MTHTPTFTFIFTDYFRISPFLLVVYSRGWQDHFGRCLLLDFLPSIFSFWCESIGRGAMHLSKGPKRDWCADGWNQRLATGSKTRGERVRSFLDSVRNPASPLSLSVVRPGITMPTTIRYATTAFPDTWDALSSGRDAVEALLQALTQGRDTLLMAWPERPGNGFTLAALAMREARASGALSSAAVAVWPWRAGMLRAARSILVHPEDVAGAARRAINDRQKGAAWTCVDDGLAHEELDMVELRLRDLMPDNVPQGVLRGRQRIDMVVRNPTLLETTAVFLPSPSGYQSDSDQILRRVRGHTNLGQSGAGQSRARSAIGNPQRSPFAIMGLPAERTPNRIGRHLASARPLDVIVLDLTKQSRLEIGDQWEKLLDVLLQALAETKGRRTPLLCLCEDAFTLRAASRVLRAHNARLRPKRLPPRELGLYVPERGLLGRSPNLPAGLIRVAFHADIKDASLVSLRDDLLDLLRAFRVTGNVTGLRAANTALSFIRRISNLPLGLHEAKTAADVLFDSDDEVDIGVRSMFRHRMALADLAAVADAGFQTSRIALVLKRVEELVDSWQTETPVSAKLSELLARGGWNVSRTLLAVPDRRIAEVLAGSDRVLRWHCTVVDHSSLRTVLDGSYFDRLIVTGPTTKVLRTILVSESSPDHVFLLGDASGAALLAGELAPLTRLHAFAAVAQRATDLLAALKRGGLDEKLDLDEAEFRVGVIGASRDIDLSREGDVYSGRRIVVHTSRHRIVYRPQSDVLMFSSNEARLFERLQAQDIEPGDLILVLDEATRDRVRRALAASRTSLAQLGAYHDYIAGFRGRLPGSTTVDKSREVLRRMREIDPSVRDGEVHNVSRWLTADLGPSSVDGTKQPRAARDWGRFRLFMRTDGVEEVLAQTYWQYAIVPTRSYRVQEGHQFNQRVVQFILDPESAGTGRPNDEGLRRLWLSLQDSIDEVTNVETIKEGLGDD